MLELSRDDIIKPLRRARLYNGPYVYQDGVHSIHKSHLLYWKGLKLFDFKHTPVQQNSYEYSGTELERAISLKFDLGKLTKKYGDCMVTIPPSHIHLIRGQSPKIEVYDDKIISETVVGNWIIKTVTKTYTTATGLPIYIPKQIALNDVFRHYVESNLSINWIKGEQTRRPSFYTYKMEIPGTDYYIKFFITGSIHSILVEGSENPVSIQDILKMNHWASIELKDIVEKASICRKVETEYEIDDPEIGMETTYVCTI